MRPLSLLVPIVAISCTDLDLDAIEDLGVAESELVAATDHVRLKVITNVRFSPSDITRPLAEANRLFRPAGLQFDFDPSVDVIVPNPALPDCGDATIADYGNNVVGKSSVAVFYCPNRGNASNSTGPNSVAWNGAPGVYLAHELGHYFGLDHIFTSYVPTNSDITIGPTPAETRPWSVEREIRTRLEAQLWPVPIGGPVPPWILQRGFAIRDQFLEQDQLPDTFYGLERHPTRSGDACDPNLRVSLVVTFGSGQTFDYGFTPTRNNPMGYYDLPNNCGLAQKFSFSPGQLRQIRESYTTGPRSQLTRTRVNDGVVPAASDMMPWTSSFDDAAGWGETRYQSTIATPDLNNDGTADICGRGVSGVWCALSTKVSFGPVSLWTSNFSDAAGWTAEQYYSTLRFPDLNGDGKADICGRGSGGIWCGLSNGSSGFSTPTLWLAQYTDAQGWNAAQYFSTLEFPDLDNDRKADVCGRGASGVWCARSDGTSSFVNFSMWSSSLKDVEGWHLPMRYRSIQFADVNRDGMADICARDVSGIKCAISLGSYFGTFSSWSTDFSDANGWDQERYYSTIAFADVNGDGRRDLCGRGVAGVLCATSTGTTFENLQQWTSAFSDASGGSLASTYETISFPDHDGNGIADVCGRTATGVFCAYSSGSSFVDYRPVTTAQSDAAGWNAPSRYRSILFADADHDGSAEVCSRDANGISCERP